MINPTSKDNTYMSMLNEITEASPANVILSNDLFKMIKEETLIYILGHFYIQVKNVLPPFCPFYLDKSLPDETYILTKSNQECDELLLKSNYKTKDK